MPNSKRKIVLYSVVFILVLFSVGCASQNQQKSKLSNDDKISQATDNGGNNSMPSPKVENTTGAVKISKIKTLYSETTNDTKLEAAIVKAYDLRPGENVRYLYNKIDLNNDKTDEIFVSLLSFSGSGGSSAAIIKIENNNYKVIDKFTLVRTPIIVSNKMTNGWNDLIMHVSGGGAKQFDALLKYGKDGYPSNPSVEPAIESMDLVEGTAILSDELNPNVGFKFTVGLENDIKNQLIGTYKFESTSGTLDESHYISIEERNGFLEGLYYGSTDDFDAAREGYTPGYFVSTMNTLQIGSGKINFYVRVNGSDFFYKPIDLKYKSTKEVQDTANPNWEKALNSKITPLKKTECSYSGIITKDIIELKGDFDANNKRVFKKIEVHTAKSN